MSVCCLSFCLGWWLRASPVGGKVSSLWQILDLKRNNQYKQGPWHPISEQSRAAFSEEYCCSMEQAPDCKRASWPSPSRARPGGSNFSSACPITSLEGKLCWTTWGSVMCYHLPSSSCSPCTGCHCEGGAGRTGKLCILAFISAGKNVASFSPMAMDNHALAPEMQTSQLTVLCFYENGSQRPAKPRMPCLQGCRGLGGNISSSPEPSVFPKEHFFFLMSCHFWLSRAADCGCPDSRRALLRAVDSLLFCHVLFFKTYFFKKSGLLWGERYSLDTLREDYF